MTRPDSLQSNRESAKRSKEKRKQEAEELLHRKITLVEENVRLQQKVVEAQVRVRQAQVSNTMLQGKFEAALQPFIASGVLDNFLSSQGDAEPGETPA